MNIKDSVVLVTGGNRGLGQALVQGLLTAGARKVYVGTRILTDTSDARIQQLKLDITNERDVATAAEACQDVTILINNAGVKYISPLLTVPIDSAREEMETNYVGTLRVVQAFAPILKKNGGGMIVNILSQLSWFALPTLTTYSASKAATMLLTDGMRMELKSQGTQVIGVYTGFMNTDLFVHVNAPKVSSEGVAANTIQGILAGQEEILADVGIQGGGPTSEYIKAALAHDRQGFYQGVQDFGK